MQQGSLALGLMLFCLAFDLVSLTGVEIFVDRNQIRCKDNQTDPVTWFKDGVNLTQNINNGEYEKGRDTDNGHPTLKFNFTTDSEGQYSCIDEANSSTLTVDPETYNNKSVAVTPDDNGTVLVPCGRFGPVTANNSQINSINLHKSLDLTRVEYNWTKQETPEGSFDVYAEANYRHLSNSNYICIARVITKVMTKEGSYHRSFRGQSQISLKIAPHVVLAAKENITQTVGGSLNVSCNAYHPNASTIITTQWTKDGETVNNVNGNLVIQSLSLNDSGVYTCNASFEGLGNNKSFSLTVIEPPPTPSPSTPITLTSTPEASSSLISEAPSSTGTVQTTTTTSATYNPATGDDGHMHVLIVSIIVLLLVVVILLALLIIFYCTRKRCQKRSRDDIESRASPLQNNPHHQSPIPLPMSSPPSSSLNNPSVTSGKQTITTWCESCCHSHTRSYPSIDRQSLAQSSCHNQCCSLSGSSHCSSKDARRHHDCHIFNHHNQNMSLTSTVPHHTCCHFVPHMHYPLPLPPPHTQPVNPSISVSHDSGCEAQKTLSNTRSEGSSCPHCVMHCHMSTDSGYHAMRTSTKEPWPGYSNETHN